MISPKEAASELYERRQARKYLAEFITYTTPGYIHSNFSRTVCAELDKFIIRVQAGIRPILLFMAPPQHGKTELVSRKLPAFLLGNFPNWHIMAASYAASLASFISQDVRRNMDNLAYQKLFPSPSVRLKHKIDRIDEFSSPNGDGSYMSDGVGGSFTGKPAHIFILDDPTKNAQEALSATVKEGHWNWYQSTSKTRMQANSGLIVMATAWAEDDLLGRISTAFRDDPRLTILKFPAINDPDEVGYNPDLPLGALVPELHPLSQLLEFKKELSDYWWSAMYQQSPKSLGGNVFKDSGLRYYWAAELPTKFDRTVTSWDCTFKDTDGTDFVVGQVWGRVGADCYLIDQIRARMSFTRTVEAVLELYLKYKTPTTLIEDKANGPAVIDVLKKVIPGLLPVEPDGSKLARAHAVTSYWEAGNIHIPHPHTSPWVKDFVSELLVFPAGANDDQVDAKTQAVRYLYPSRGGGLKISEAALRKFGVPV